MGTKNSIGDRPNTWQFLAIGLGIVGITVALLNRNKALSRRKKAGVVPDNSSQTAPSKPRRALIVGLGIAGMSAALGLKKAGWEPVIVERSAERRTGGYFIGLSKEGFEAAIYFGIRNVLATHTPDDYFLWEIDKNNKRHQVGCFTDHPNHPEVVQRGYIEAALWSGIESNTIEVRFSTMPVTIATDTDAAVVCLRNLATDQASDEVFDLVVGADGVRSSVRRTVFGPDEDFMKSFGSIVCAFKMKEPVPDARPTDGLTVAEENRSLWIFPFSDSPPAAMFTYRPSDVDAQFTMSPRDALHHAYAGMSGDGVVDFALKQFDKAENHLFDSVHLVDMPRWQHNRVMLLGDAAWCLTLYSGYGATAAMHAGAVLGKLLAEQEDVQQALNDWEAEMRPFIMKHSLLAPLKAQTFIPSNRVVLGIRSALITSRLLVRLRAAASQRRKARKKAIQQIFMPRS